MNSIYQMMNKGPQNNNMMAQFQKFMNAYKGQDPRQMLQQIIGSGKVSQDQLNQAQNTAGQISGMLQSMRGQFGM